MPTNEEGEFELVLGNRQLLSVFFIFVLLLGVFFTMGYILGRGTSPKEVATSRPPAPIEVTPSRPDPRPSPSPEPVTPPPSAPIRTEPVKPEPVKPEPVKPEPPKPEPVKAEPKPEPKKAETKKAEKKEPEPKPEVRRPEPEKPAPARPSAGGPGSYLQVSATTKADGQALVAKLAGRGFPAITSPVPNSDLVRVLVGPVADVADTRAKLRAAGYDSILRKM